jgi:hypothetical protein
METINNGWTEKIKELEDEVARLTAERIAIQNNSRALTCVFCGMVYPPGTPPSNHAALVAHVQECPKHPLRLFKRRAVAAEKYLHVLRDAYEFLGKTDDELVAQEERMFQSCCRLDLIPVIDAELEYRHFSEGK